MTNSISGRPRIIDATTKGFNVDAPTSVSELVAGSPTIFDGPFVWPLMVIERDALEHNIRLHAKFCQSHDVRFAPHGKTTMAPMIFAAQFAAGAWALTAATISQVRAYRSFGVTRVLLANELVDARGIEWLLTELENSPDFEFWCYVDSTEGVAILQEALNAHSGKRSLHVLIEFGHGGGRTGLRSREEAIKVASAVSRVDRLTVDGVSFYEGTVAGPATPDNIISIRELAREVRLLVGELYAQGFVDRDNEVYVSAGGSVYFDVVAEELVGHWPEGIVPVVVLRSGAYVTHDNGFYESNSGYGRLVSQGAPRSAMHLWAQVVSCPEPGIAIVGFGKRDAPIDTGMPVPLRLRQTDGTTIPLSGWTVRALNDHHAFFEGSTEATKIKVGDVVELGISHPCTAFDRWQLIPVIDDNFRVVDCVETFF